LERSPATKDERGPVHTMFLPVGNSSLGPR
jgi:hypothetical protein